MPGKIFVASMNMRGNHAECPEKKAIKVNVTSGQAKRNANRLLFSPMTPIPGGYRNFWNFESFWQSGKVFKHLDHEKSRQWWLNLKEPKRRYPNSKGRKVLYAQWPHTPPLDYIESRKQVYVPEYYGLIADKDLLLKYQRDFQSGKDFVIFDYDGPRLEDGEVTCLELTKELLIEKINDPRHPFGHGYIVAASIAGIKPEEYI